MLFDVIRPKGISVKGLWKFDNRGHVHLTSYHQTFRLCENWMES